MLTDELKAAIIKELDGIGSDERRGDKGWWETSTGAAFGRERLAAVLRVVDEFAALRPQEAEMPEEPPTINLLRSCEVNLIEVITLKYIDVLRAHAISLAGRVAELESRLRRFDNWPDMPDESYLKKETK